MKTGYENYHFVFDKMNVCFMLHKKFNKNLSACVL